MSEDGTTPRPSISSVDARVGRLEEAQGRLEAAQLQQDGVMKLIQLEQTHIREIMTSRFVGLEEQIRSQSSKLDQFMGKMDSLITEGMKQQTELSASPLGRQVDERLQKVESWREISQTFHSEVRGMGKIVTAVLGSSLASFILAAFAVAKTLGWL